MKKYYLIAAVLVFLTAIMIAFPPQAEPSRKIYVPVTVQPGDQLGVICRELATTYGDERDWREIVYYCQKQNNLDLRQPIYPGDKLLVELVIPEGEEK
ncbi:MAG: hypothetical protein DBY32_04495 [Phascolarctobacterium sp.]|nr:MAG: hypothetical protein DBY32_04495 [Phascolarctobacterium sp.]